MREIIDKARAQGWRIERTRKGWQFIPPDRTGKIVQWHGTPSAWLAIRNFLSKLEQQGFRMDDD